MATQIRGIECSLHNGNIEDLLIFLSNKSFDFFVQHCSTIDNNRMILPRTSLNFCISSDQLCELAKTSIWELVLHIYPTGSNKQQIETYEDFLKSECLCCLIFYDCGMLDIYIKGYDLNREVYNILNSLQAEDIKYITDFSDGRTFLY